MRLKTRHTDLILQPAPSEVPVSLSSGLGTGQPQGANPISMTHAPFANPHLCPQPAESARLLSLNCTNQEIPGHDECHTASSSYLTAAVKQKCWISSSQLEEIIFQCLMPLFEGLVSRERWTAHIQCPSPWE